MTTAQPFAYQLAQPVPFRSEGFAEDLCDSHPAHHGGPALREHAQAPLIARPITPFERGGASHAD